MEASSQLTPVDLKTLASFKAGTPARWHAQTKTDALRPYLSLLHPCVCVPAPAPSPALELLGQALCILFSVKPPSWESAHKKLLSDLHFFDKCMSVRVRSERGRSVTIVHFNFISMPCVVTAVPQGRCHRVDAHCARVFRIGQRRSFYTRENEKGIIQFECDLPGRCQSPLCMGIGLAAVCTGFHRNGTQTRSLASSRGGSCRITPTSGPRDHRPCGSTPGCTPWIPPIYCSSHAIYRVVRVQQASDRRFGCCCLWYRGCRVSRLFVKKQSECDASFPIGQAQSQRRRQ